MITHTIEEFIDCVQPNVNAWAEDIKKYPELPGIKELNINRMKIVLDTLKEVAPFELDLIFYVSNLINECEEWL